MVGQNQQKLSSKWVKKTENDPKMSSSTSFCLSPNSGAFTAHTFNVPLILLTIRVAKASLSISLAIIKRDLFGRKKVEMIYRFKDRDTIKVGQYKKTIRTQRNTSTAWLYVERGIYGSPLHDYLLEGPRLQILKVRDFLVESVINQQSSDENYDGESWSIGSDELDCEPFIYGGGHGTGYGDRVDDRVQEGFK